MYVHVCGSLFNVLQLRSIYSTVGDQTFNDLKKVKAENAQLKQKLQEAEQKCKEAEARRDEYCLIAESRNEGMVVAEQIWKKGSEENIKSKERLLLETLARKPERNVPLEWLKHTLQRGCSRGVLADPSEATVWKAVEAYYEKRRMREQGSTEVGMRDQGSTEVGMREQGSTEVSMREQGSTEVGMREQGSPEVGMKKQGSTEVGMREQGSTEVGMREQGSTEVDMRDLESTEVGIIPHSNPSQ